MKKLPTMIDMRKTPAEKMEDMGPVGLSEVSNYDYGLSLCLNKESLDKLNLDTDDVEVGDFIHLHALAKVTCVSMRESDSGNDRRVELVLTHISAEDENEENEESEEEEKKPTHLKMYKK